MLKVTAEQRNAAADHMADGVVGKLDPAAPLLVREGFCPLCGAEVEYFDDQGSLREYHISGMCQGCQNRAFGTDGDGPMELPIDPVAFGNEEDA